MPTPRVVTVTRPTVYENLLARHSTHENAKFFLSRREQSIEAAQQQHRLQEDALQMVSAAIPLDWRRSKIDRADLDRFLFEPGDIVVVVGQDGLVPNVAKYLDSQLVIGVNPDPSQYDGVLVRHAAESLRGLLPKAVHRDVAIEMRSMVTAVLDDGQQLTALNEIFVGVRTHQSARYVIGFGDDEERHSSSGLIVATGTGATGWARSIRLQRHSRLQPPKPENDELLFYVREAFPSVSTATSLTEGVFSKGTTLRIRSENNENGVIFGDGIEADFLPFDWGTTATVRLATTKLNLVAAA